MFNQPYVNNSDSSATTSGVISYEQNTIATTSSSITSIFNTTELPETSSRSPLLSASIPGLALSFENEAAAVMPTSEMTMLREPETTTELADLFSTQMGSPFPSESTDEVTDFNQLIENMFEEFCPTELSDGKLLDLEGSLNETFTSVATPATLTQTGTNFSDFKIKIYQSATVLHSSPSISIFAPYNPQIPYKVPAQKINSIHTRPGTSYMGDSYIFFIHQDEINANTITIKANLKPVFVIDSPLPIFVPTARAYEPNDESFELRFDTNLIKNFCINSNIVRVTMLTHEGSLLMDQSALSFGSLDFVPVSDNFTYGQIRLNMALPHSFHQYVRRLPSLHMMITVRYIDPMTFKIYDYDTHIRPSAK